MMKKNLAKTVHALCVHVPRNLQTKTAVPIQQVDHYCVDSKEGTAYG